MGIAGFEKQGQYEAFARAVLTAAQRDTPQPLSGVDLWRAEKERVNEARVLQTGVGSVDGLLGGGIHTREITELVGIPGSCKTLLAMQVALNTAFSRKETVVYVDTCNSFSLARVQCICESQDFFEEDGSAVKEDEGQVRTKLSLIKVIPSFTPDSLFEVLQEIHDTTEAVPRLVVVDSISSILGPYIGGKNDSGNKLLTHAYTMMREITAKHNLAILVTNSTSRADLSSPDCQSIEAPSLGVAHVKPAMGHMWGHYGQHVRLFLKPNLDPGHPAAFTAEVIKGGARLEAGGAAAGMRATAQSVESVY